MAMRAANAFPRFPLYGMIGLALAALAAAVVGQTWDVGTVRLKTGAPVAMRDIAFRQDADALVVLDARSGGEIARLPEAQPGFVHGLVRGLRRARQQMQINDDAPYRLIQWRSGQISLSDTVSGERIYLDAFGPDNAAAMARFLGGD